MHNFFLHWVLNFLISYIPYRKFSPFLILSRAKLPEAWETCWTWCTSSQHDGPTHSRHVPLWAAWRYSWSSSLRSFYRPSSPYRSLRGLCTVTGRMPGPLQSHAPCPGLCFLFLHSPCVILVIEDCALKTFLLCKGSFIQICPEL